MRIGIDARELCGRPTGVGRYLAGLLREWMTDDRGSRHEFVLYAADTLEVPFDARRLATRLIEGPSGTWWEQVRLPRVAAEVTYARRSFHGFVVTDNLSRDPSQYQQWTIPAPVDIASTGCDSDRSAPKATCSTINA